MHLRSRQGVRSPSWPTRSRESRAGVSSKPRYDAVDGPDGMTAATRSTSAFQLAACWWSGLGLTMCRRRRRSCPSASPPVLARPGSERPFVAWRLLSTDRGSLAASCEMAPTAANGASRPVAAPSSCKRWRRRRVCAPLGGERVRRGERVEPGIRAGASMERTTRLRNHLCPVSSTGRLKGGGYPPAMRR
jgi:hypothetical protein